MSEKIKEIKQYYDEKSQHEWERLGERYPYEKYITTRMIDRFLTPKGSILDIGGGPGQYSIHYAKRGHTVTLLDLSEGNIAFAKEKAKEEGVTITAIQGNALDLSQFPDNSFDDVFLMGPLYHLLEEENRIRAIEEARRILKPGGYLFVSFILVFGGVDYALRENPACLLNIEDKLHFELAVKDESGCPTNGFTHFYGTTILDAKALMFQIPGLSVKKVFGQESILAPFRYILEGLSEELRNAWFEYALGFCDQEIYLSHAEHLMIVAEKVE